MKMFRVVSFDCSYGHCGFCACGKRTACRRSTTFLQQSGFALKRYTRALLRQYAGSIEPELQTPGRESEDSQLSI